MTPDFRARGWLKPETVYELLGRGDGEGVKVAVLDSGIEASHPYFDGLQLEDNITVKENDCLLEIEEGGADSNGHGTAVAGVIKSVAPKARIGSFCVLRNDGSVSPNKNMVAEKIALGAQEAIRRGYSLLNCSLGDGDLTNLKRHKDWIDMAYLAGVHVVAACNNQNFDRTELPGYFPTVIAVNMARTSEMEAFYRLPGHLVEFSAHGVWVKVPWREGRYTEVIGSSFAAPRVAGMLARMLSVQPDLTPLEAKAVLQHLAEPWTPSLAAPNQPVPA